MKTGVAGIAAHTLDTDQYLGGAKVDIIFTQWHYHLLNVFSIYIFKLIKLPLPASHRCRHLHSWTQLQNGLMTDPAIGWNLNRLLLAISSLLSPLCVSQQ